MSVPVQSSQHFASMGLQAGAAPVFQPERDFPGSPTSIERSLPVRIVADDARARARVDATERYVDARSERLSRVLNIVLALGTLILLSPLLLLVALAIKLTSPGPILYVQTRVGLDRRRRQTPAAAYDRRIQDLGGRVFTIYKFRSMLADAERGCGAVWATAHDSRVTPIGRFMRKCRIDEIPQLLNVLVGDMNIVGPRPERPSIFDNLRRGIAEYPLRQRAKPGITGWAQVNQCYDQNLDDVRRKVSYDLEYLQRRGLAEDVRILIRTVPIVLFRQNGW